ncbi:MAG TPA: hypothetical protein PK562_07385, partial [Candidatus Omnitrophota bacterium]|nr:hypothetical protein [Candidatus Omnitrophota bacterium]
MKKIIVSDSSDVSDNSLERSAKAFSQLPDRYLTFLIQDWLSRLQGDKAVRFCALSVWNDRRRARLTESLQAELKFQSEVFRLADSAETARDRLRALYGFERQLVPYLGEGSEGMRHAHEVFLHLTTQTEFLEMIRNLAQDDFQQSLDMIVSMCSGLRSRGIAVDGILCDSVPAATRAATKEEIARNLHAIKFWALKEAVVRAYKQWELGYFINGPLGHNYELDVQETKLKDLISEIGLTIPRDSADWTYLYFRTQIQENYGPHAPLRRAAVKVFEKTSGPEWNGLSLEEKLGWLKNIAAEHQLNKVDWEKLKRAVNIRTVVPDYQTLPHVILRDGGESETERRKSGWTGRGFSSVYHLPTSIPIELHFNLVLLVPAIIVLWVLNPVLGALTLGVYSISAIHEAAHALVMIRFKRPIRRIRLSAVSSYVEEDPATAITSSSRSGFYVAAAGPLSNLILAVIGLIVLYSLGIAPFS